MNHRGLAGPFHPIAKRYHYVRSTAKSAMANLRVFIGQVLALAIVVTVSANAQFGAIAPEVITGAPNEKFDMSQMIEPDCSPPFDRLELLLAEGSETNCFIPPGEWSGVDFMVMGPSLFILLSGRIKVARVGTKKDRFYKGAFAAGVAMFSIAIMDRLGVLPTQVNSEGLSDLIPLDLPPLGVQLGIAAVGCLLMMGPKYWEAEAITQATESVSKRRNIAHEFRTKFGSETLPLHARAGSNQRITRSKILHKDSHLKMRKQTAKGLKVYATCPFCSGGGCAKCGNKGTL